MASPASQSPGARNYDEANNPDPIVPQLRSPSFETHHEVNLENAGILQTAWNAFKAVLPVVKKVSVVFPPLQSAVGGLIAVVSAFDVRHAP